MLAWLITLIIIHMLLWAFSRISWICIKTATTSIFWKDLSDPVITRENCMVYRGGNNCLGLFYNKDQQRKIMKNRWRNKALGYCFILPAVIYMLVFIGYPCIPAR